MATLPITRGFYKSPSLPVSHQEGKNVYLSPVEKAGLSPEILRGTPGSTQLCTTGTTTKNRGARKMGTIPYFVSGGRLFSVSSAYAVTNIGAIAGTSRVSMADNGLQLMILVPGSTGYIYTAATTTLSTITDGDFDANGNPQHVVFIDGYFVCTTDSKKIIASDLNDGTGWNALSVGTAESDPDDTVAPVVVKNQLFVTGSITTEGYQNVPGSGTFPFQRNNIFMDKGCVSPYSLINSQGTFFMVGAGNGESPAIWKFEDNDYVKISTDAIDEVLLGLTTTELAAIFSWQYAQAGAFFIGFQLPNETYLYEYKTKEWATRTSQINNFEKRWRVASIVQAYGEILVADEYDGRIGKLEMDVYTEYTNTIVRVATGQPFANEGREIRVPVLELTMESGVANSSVTDPKVSLETSDNGRTFKQPLLRRLGKLGDYTRRTFWRKLGRFSRFVVFRWTLTDAVKAVFIKLETH